MALKKDVVTKPKMPQTWRKHLLQYSNTTTPKIRTPQLLDDNILKTGQDIAGDKYKFWYFLRSAVSSRSLAYKEKVQS